MGEERSFSFLVCKSTRKINTKQINHTNKLFSPYFYYYLAVYTEAHPDFKSLNQFSFLTICSILASCKIKIAFLFNFKKCLLNHYMGETSWVSNLSTLNDLRDVSLHLDSKMGIWYSPKNTKIKHRAKVTNTVTLQKQSAAKRRDLVKVCTRYVRKHDTEKSAQITS